MSRAKGTERRTGAPNEMRQSMSNADVQMTMKTKRTQRSLEMDAQNEHLQTDA